VKSNKVLTIIPFLSVIMISLFSCTTTRWLYIEPESAPSPRGYTAMVYDSESDRIIMFSGQKIPAGPQFYRDTWVFDMNTMSWNNMNPSVHPSARAYHTMTYDAESDRVILFGGGEPGSMPSYKKIFNETWAYDYNSNTWTSMHPENPPSVRVYTDMSYDVESDRIILFGGGTSSFGQENIDSSGSNETWIYDFNSDTWTNIDTKNNPSPRKKHVVCYDRESDNIVLFGGAVFTERGYIKSWDNETWTFKY
jgi:N-acetylneuraminic acid mutarotase